MLYAIVALTLIGGTVYGVYSFIQAAKSHARLQTIQRREENRRLAEEQAAEIAKRSENSRERRTAAQRVFTRGGRYLVALSEDALIAAMRDREAAARLIAAGQVMREDLRADVEVELIGGGGWSTARVRLPNGNVVWIEARGLVFR